PVAIFGTLPLAHSLIDVAYRGIATRRGCTHVKCDFVRERPFKKGRSPVRPLKVLSAAGAPLPNDRCFASSSDGRPAAELYHGRRTGDRRSLMTAWIPSVLLPSCAVAVRP